MYGKIEISGKIELLTGMHIGASDSFAAIGAIDTPVIKDPISGLPIIPGSSLKGKMRTLLAKAYNEKPFVKWEGCTFDNTFDHSRVCNSSHSVDRIFFFCFCR